MPSEEAVHGADADRSTALGQLRLDLDQGNIPLLSKQLLDEITVRFDPARVAVTPATLGNRSTMLQRKASPADRARDADTKMGCCRSATHTPINRSNDTVPKVL